MPYFHCLKCDFEWEGRITSRCPWCGSRGYILEEKTPLEKAVERGIDFITNTKLGGE